MTAVTAVVRGGTVIQALALRGEASLIVIDIDVPPFDLAERHTLLLDGVPVAQEDWLPAILEEAQGLMEEKRWEGKLELLSFTEDGKEHEHRLTLWKRGQRIPTVVFLVKDGLVDPFVIAPPVAEVAVDILDLDACGEPDHVVVGIDDDHILEDQEIQRLLPGKSFPDGSHFPTVEDALEAVQELLSRYPGTFVKLDIEGRDEEGETLWVYTLWEREPLLED